MAKNQDYVLILERSASSLKPQRIQNSDDIYLEGIAAVFGKENSNQRIYEEKEYLPHLEYLQEKISKRRLCGELDHPKEFDISLRNLSHVIEKLSYNKEDRTIRIRVKLLDTPAGKIARALVEAGIPISISSRAAGTVGANRRVDIKRIFTYDLVADPGFEIAQLDRVYESFGHNFKEKNQDSSVLKGLSMMNESLGLKNDSNIKIYRINDQEKIEKILSRKETPIKKQSSMENFVTAEELNEYTKLLKKEMDSIKSSVSSLKAPKTVKVNEKRSPKEGLTSEERISKLEKYCDYLAENLEASIKYGEYLAENLEGSLGKNKKMDESLKRVIAYSKYLAEHLDNNISYAEYIAENVDHGTSKVATLTEKIKQAISYSEYVAENVDRTIRYSEYLGENLDKSISYGDYLAEKLDSSISYQNYLAENLDRNISYGEYLAENLDKGIRYSESIGEKLNKGLDYSDYLGENLDKSISYSNYLAEKLSTNISYSEYLAESMSKSGGNKSLAKELNKAVNENRSVSGFAGNYAGIGSKIDNLLESVNKQKTDQLISEKRYAFLNLVRPEVKAGFLSLNEAEKQKVANALNERNYSSEKEIVSIMGDALTEQAQSGEKFLDMMPDEFKGAWQAMNEMQKASIIAQSKTWKLDTAYQINYFWKSRGISLPSKNVQSLDESKKVIAGTSGKGYNSDYVRGIAEALDQRFRK